MVWNSPPFARHGVKKPINGLSPIVCKERTCLFNVHVFNLGCSNRLVGPMTQTEQSREAMRSDTRGIIILSRIYRFLFRGLRGNRCNPKRRLQCAIHSTVPVRFTKNLREFAPYRTL